MLLFFKACIVHVVFDALVTSLSMSDSQERGAGHLKKKKDVCMEYETWDLGGSKFLSVTAFPITFVFLTNLACPWAFAKKKSCLKLVEIFSGHVATKKQNYPWWNIAYKSKLQPSVSIFWAYTEGKILRYNVGMGQKSDTTTSTEMIGWVWDIHVTLKFSGDFWFYTGLTWLCFCIFLAVLDVVCESFTLQNIASFSILSN